MAVVEAPPKVLISADTPLELLLVISSTVLLPAASATGSLILGSSSVSEAAGSVAIGVDSDRSETVYIAATSLAATLAFRNPPRR